VPLVAAILGVVGSYLLPGSGALTLDLGIGRRTRPLGPLTERIAAPAETVFDVIATPWGRTVAHSRASIRSDAEPRSR
jgi:hypothetical protein